VVSQALRLMEPPNAKRRPVLIVTRNEAITLPNNIVVAPVTSTIRANPTNIAVGAREGIDYDSVASFDNLSAVPQSVLTPRLGAIDPQRLPEICDALNALAAC